MIVNDFGEIGIDGDLLRDKASRVVEVVNGCICCTTQSELPFTIQMLLRRYQPDYVVIEMSGEGDPAPVVRQLRGLAPLIELLRRVAVIDLTLMPDTLVDDCVSRNGILGADLLVLNKTDLASPEHCSAWRQLLAQMNPTAQDVEALHAEIDPAILLQGVGRRQAISAGHSYDHEHHHQALHTYSLRTDEIIDTGRLERLMEQHGERFVRAKGFVAIRDQVFEFQAVRGSWSLKPFDGALSDNCTRLVFLSRSLRKEDMQELCERTLLSSEDKHTYTEERVSLDP